MSWFTGVIPKGVNARMRAEAATNRTAPCEIGALPPMICVDSGELREIAAALVRHGENNLAVKVVEWVGRADGASSAGGRAV